MSNSNIKDESKIVFLNKEERVFLMEIGMAAAANGYTNESLDIFNSLELVGGDAISLAVGRCFAYAGSNKINQGFQELQKVWSLDNISEVDMAMTLLALQIDQLDAASVFARRCADSNNKLLNDFAVQAFTQIEANNIVA